MKAAGIIPARFASTRFPGKPLIDILGKSMIRRVYEQCLKADSLDEVIVATDDLRIADHVRSFDGKVVMTADTHTSGTDRCAEVAARLPEFDVFVNIQGDEPLIDPAQIDLLTSCFGQGDVQLATLVKVIASEEELFNPNTPKVIVTGKMEAAYFSRATIPYLRGEESHDWLKRHVFYKHIGVYAYTRNALLEITELPVSSLEKAESLEQLRWIENGYRIRAAVTEKEGQAIDTPEDLERLLASGLITDR